MKKSTLVAFLLLAFSLTNQANLLAAPYHVENIVLKNFQAVSIASGARIIWEFTSEERNVTCNLEKSIDGVNFVALRTIELASTREQALHSYIDRNASGQTFYRLRITKQSYTPYISPIVSLNILHVASGIQQTAGTGQQLNSLFGDLSLNNNVMSVRLVDISGQAKIKQYIKGTELERVFRPSFSSLPAGYYVLNINDLHNQPLLTKCIYKF